MKENILTGDRPTGRLHIGHYVGSLKKRLEYQETDNLYVFIADLQALTDNFKNPDLVRKNTMEVAIDYLSVGLDPNKCTIFIQSQIPELSELNMYYLNLVTLSRLQRNPTVKQEIKQKNMDKSISTGFLTYPISQAADITAFDCKYVPVGEDQLPVVEQAREIVETFNKIYGETLIMPEAVLPSSKICRRLPGIDGNEKMGKSLNNAIYLADDSNTVKQKVMSMYTDPNHIKIEDKGQIEGNMVFTYLDAFCEKKHFEKYLNEYKNLDELKNHYKQGGLGDVKIKMFLYNILEELLTPIREKRKYYENNKDEVLKILEIGSKKAREKAQEVLKRVRTALKIEYF